MKYFPYIFLLIIASVALKALFATPYLPLMHDQVQAERVFEMAKSLSFGQFPVRLVGDLGYGFGYPLFNYYAPLPYYMGALLFLLGLNLIVATKLMIAIAFIAAGFTMYLCAKRYVGELGALLSATLYVLAPYHGVQLYVRGALGELVTYALFPLVVYGLLELWSAKLNRRKAVLGVLGLVGIAMGHTLGLYITLLLWALYSIVLSVVLSRRNKPFLATWLKRNLAFIGIALALSAFFWMPAFFELRYINFSVASGNDVNYRDHFVTLGQLWNSPWGFGGSTKGVDKDGMSFMIGKITLLLALVSLLLVYIKRGPHKKIWWGMAVLALVSIFSMTESSSAIWEAIPAMNIIQFPWRFLIVANFALTFLAGSGMYLAATHFNLKQINRYGLLLIVCVAFYVLFSLTQLPKTKYFEANGYYPRDEAAVRNQQHLRYEASKISDEYLPKDVPRPSSTDSVSMDTVSCLALCVIKNVQFEPTRYRYDINIQQESPVFIDKSYFPDFHVKVDTYERKLLIGPGNTLGVMVPTGRHTVEFIFGNTVLRVMANSISLLAFLALILYPFRRKLWNLKQKLK